MMLPSFWARVHERSPFSVPHHHEDLHTAGSLPAQDVPLHNGSSCASEAKDRTCCTNFPVEKCSSGTQITRYRRSSFIQPCRSICIAVRDRCAPVLRCHGSHWPSSLDCDRFPADEDICLGSLSNEQKHIVKVVPKPTCQICPAVEEFLTHKNVLDLFCTNNFAVKVKLSRKQIVFSIQEYNVDCREEMITPGLVLPYDACSMIEQWLLVNEDCTQKMTHTHRPMVYLIVGTTVESDVLVHQVYRWSRWNSQLTLSTRKWRQHKCT